MKIVGADYRRLWVPSQEAEGIIEKELVILSPEKNR